VIEYVVVGAVLLTYVVYVISAPERRRRWLARINAPSPSPLDAGDSLPQPALDTDAGADHHHHDHNGDHGGHHDGHHGIDFDMGGGHHH